MTDVVDAPTRSRMMAVIRGKGTKPELAVRKYLHAKGLGFRIHVKDLPGKPDIVCSKYRAVIFVHGCFWHQHEGCKFATMPSSRTDFWANKLSENIARDKYQMAALIGLGWRVFVIWECELKNSIECLELLYRNIIKKE